MTPTQPATSMPGTATESELSRFESEGGSTVPDERDDRPGGLRESGAERRGRILVVYAARQPHTAAIVDALATRLRRHGFRVEVGDASIGTMPPPQDYDVVVLGSPMGFDDDAAVIARYIDDHREALAEIPSALFTVSSSGSIRDHDPGGFLEQFLGTLEWEPAVAAAFAGGEPFPRDGLLLRLARGMGRQGIYQDRHALETDWSAVERFADMIAIELAGAAVTVEGDQPHATTH
jgi:menaquinone-dependent protoporphyrinogen IX oxidase